MTRRGLKQSLMRGDAVFGLMQTYPNPIFTELAAVCDYDFIVADCEHGLFSDRDILSALHAVQATDTALFVRMRDHDTAAIGRYLNMGAKGILVPDVTTAAQAQLLVRATLYPPHGTRGFAPSAQRVSAYGTKLTAHIAAPLGDAVLAIQIESMLGVENLADILDVDGIDAVIVGPADLTANLGAVTDYSSPAFVEALARIEHSAKQRGKTFGMPPLASQPIELLLRRGHRIFIVGSDIGLTRDALQQHLQSARGLADNSGIHAPLPLQRDKT